MLEQATQGNVQWRAVVADICDGLTNFDFQHASRILHSGRENLQRVSDVDH